MASLPFTGGGANSGKEPWMKVRYLKEMGTVRGPAIRRGDEAEVTKEQAERLIEKGVAEPVAQKKTKRAEKRS